jgi:hypothetical protein
VTPADGLLAERGPFVRRASALSLLLALGLGATGRFRAAAALTLGAFVAIVGALWLTGVVRRFGAPDMSAASGFNWKIAATGLLRYGFAGLVLYGAVRAFPEEVPWLLLGTSAAVAAAVWQGLAER